MALDNVLKIYDEQGNPVDYDILASDVKFQDGKDLPTKLGELEEEIGEGGYTPPQGGIPKTDLAPAVQTSLDKADTAVQDPNYVHTSNDYTTAEKNKLQNLPTNPVTSISVNGQNPQTPVGGNVNIEVQGTAGDDGITPHIGANGNWWVGPETDSNNDTGVHAQGPAGTSYTSADLEIGNALNGQGDVLGMPGAMQIKNNLDFVYSKLQALFNALGNIAFWDGKPANLLPQSLDWSVPQKTVTLDLAGSNFTVLHGSTPVVDGGTIQVDEGSDLVLTIVPASNYVLENVTSNTTGVIISQDLTTVRLPEVTANVTLDLTVSVVQVFGITYNLTDCAAPSGVTNPVSIASGGTATIELETDVQGYVMPASLPTGAVTGATASYTRDANDDQKATLVLTNATGAVSVTLAAAEIGLKMVRGYYYGVTQPNVLTSEDLASGITAQRVVTTERIKISQGTSVSSYYVYYGLTIGSGYNQTYGQPCMLRFERADGTRIAQSAWFYNNDNRHATAANEVVNELTNNDVYVRACFALTESGGSQLTPGCIIKYNSQPGGSGGTTLFDAASNAYTVVADKSEVGL